MYTLLYVHKGTLDKWFIYKHFVATHEQLES